MIKKAQLIKYSSSKILLEYVNEGMLFYEEVPREFKTNKIKKLASQKGGTAVLVYKSRNKLRKIKKQKLRPISSKEIEKDFDLLDSKFPSKK